MGTQEDITSKSDSGYDDAASLSAPDANQSHPLTKKGYDVATAATLQVGDVFEFLWADAHEYQWEWKCLGYVRFIVLRHTDTFPHYAACIPVSVGNKGMGDFTKPGIDHHQQGFIFAEGDRNPGVRQPGGGSALPYSPIGVELKPGKLRVNSNSRANYADIVEVDHDAEIMVVGSVNRYFDRLRRNVNRAVMRQILRRSLEEYCERKARGSTLDLRSKTIESNPARFVMGDGIAEERSEDDLPHDEPARQDDPPQSPTYSHRNGKKHDEAVAGLEESSNRRSTGNVLSEDSDDFEGRRRQRDHRQRQDQGHSRRVSRTSRTSRQSREVLPLEEELEKAEASRPGWFRRFSSILDKEKEKEHAQDWSNYAARPNHRRSTSVETQTGANHESRQSSPRRKPRARPTVDPVESRISADPRSMIDLAAAGRSRPNPRPNSAGE